MKNIGSTIKKTSKILYTRILLLIISLSVFFAISILPTTHVHADTNNTTVPSIEYKGTPDVIPTNGIYAEIIKDTTPESHEQIDAILSDITRAQIYITSLGDAQQNYVDYPGYDEQNKVEQAIINNNLVIAYNELKACTSIGELNNKGLDPILNERAKKINENYLSYVYVVTDVFDIKLVNSTDQALLDSSVTNYCRVTLKPSFKVVSNDEVLVIHKSLTDGLWKVVPREDTVVTPEGYITAYFDTMCPIAILKVSNVRINNLQDYIDNTLIRTCICPSWCPFCDYLTIGGVCFCFMIPVIVLLSLALMAAIAIYNNLEILRQRERFKRPKAVIGPDIDIFEDDEIATSKKKKKKAIRKPKLTSRLLYPKLTPIPAFDISNLPAEVYPNIDDNYITLFYNRSFTSRMHNATDFMKESYQKLKDTLLSHNINNKVSWRFDAFRQGRKTVARIGARGKSLYLYVQLDPLQFEGIDAWNHVENVSDKKSQQLTPTRVKINNKKGLKQALKILNILFKEKDIKEVEYVQKDFISALTPKDDRTFINMGLVKLRVRRTAEKIRYAKSIKIQDVTTKESVSTSKDNDAINMIDYTSQIQKPKRPVVVYTDEISNAFENGELVTLDELKRRIKKFPKRSTYLKIENRGSLDKRLIVNCDNIDIESTKMILLSGGRVLKSKKVE